MWLTRLCLRYPVFTITLMAAFVVMGAFAWKSLAVEEFPDIEFPYVVVTTDYAGAAPEAVESEVTRHLEEAINTVAGVKRIISTSYDGYSRIAVEFSLGVPIAVAVQDVRDKVAATRVNFGRDVGETLVERYRPDTAPVMTFALQSDALDARSLSELATSVVVRRLQNVPGVGRISLLGDVPRELRIELLPERMEALGIGVEQVMSALRHDNRDAPAGDIRYAGRERVVQVTGRLTSPAQFHQVVVAQRGQAPVLLDQVARIIDGEREPRSLSLLNGKRVVSLEVIKMPGANTIELVDALHERLPVIQDALPDGVKFIEVVNAARSIRASLAEVKASLVEGAVLAVLIVFIFLRSWRSTVITGLTLPIALMGTLFFLNVFGLTLNTMTLMALSLSVGLLIDDAIVVRENIVRHVAMGKGRYQAALDGTREIGLAVLATTLTIVAVFLPVAFMGGIIGRFFYQFGVAVACAVLLSMLVSFTLDPMLSSFWRESAGGKARSRWWQKMDKWLEDFSKKLDQLSCWYIGIVRWALRHRGRVIAFAAFSLVLAVFASKFVGKEFVPEPDLAEISIHFSTPSGSSLDYSSRKSAQLTQMLKQMPEVREVYAAINSGMEVGHNRVILRVMLVPRNQRQATQAELVKRMREQLDGVAGVELTSAAAAKESIGGLKPVQVSLQGQNLRELQRIAAEFQQKVASVQGIVDLESSLKEPRPVVSLNVDRDRAAEVGLSVAQVASALRPLIAGETVGSWQDDAGENHDVRVQLPAGARTSASDVAALPLLSANGEMIYAGQLANFSEATGATQVNRRNLNREVLFSANVSGRPAGDVGADIERVAASMVLPAGYRFVTQGANNDMKESVGYAMTALLMGAIFIYMLLAVQFGSFLHPFTIMTSLPLSLVGVFVSLAICRSSLNLFSIIGIVTLMGLVTKNAILLVDFIIMAQREEGCSRHEAIVRAGMTRLRPILMTTAAMVAGMIPLALGLGEGGEQRAPMAHALIGGLIASTMLTLVVVPVMFTLLDDARIWCLARFRQQGVTDASQIADGPGRSA